MAFDRTTIRTGPCKAVFDSATYFFSGGLTLALTKSFFSTPTDAFGELSPSLDKIMIEISGTPTQWTSPDKLWPYASHQVGQSLLGGTDKPMVITPINGAPITVVAAVVTKVPDLVFSSNKPIFRGAATWRGMLANATDWSDLAARLSIGSDASGVALTGIDVTKFPRDTYSATWNSTTFKTEAGFEVSGNLQFKEQMVDTEGDIDLSFDQFEVTCRFTPVGITETALLTLLALQGTGIARGKAAVTSDLVITGSAGNGMTLKNAYLRSAPYRYANGDKRLGQIEIVTSRATSAGVLAPLFTLATAA